MGYLQLLYGIYFLGHVASALKIEGPSDARIRSSFYTGTTSLKNPLDHELSHHSRVKRQSHTAVNSAAYYSGCGVTKSCIPEHCLDTHNCYPYLVTWVLPANTSVDYMHFQLIALHVDEKNQTCNKPDSRRYVALGFSAKAGKKKVAVVECSKTSSTSNDAKVTLGWSSKNYYRYYDKAFNCDSNTNSGHLKTCKVELDADENIFCEFFVRKRVVRKQEIYDFTISEFYIHLTSGCDAEVLRKGFDKGGKQFSTQRVIHFHRLKQNPDHGFDAARLKFHGALMTVAWCVFIPNGMFFARYFKESYVGVAVCKFRFWFAGHIIVQILGFVTFLGAHVIGAPRRVSTTEIRFTWPTNPSLLFHYRIGVLASLMLCIQVVAGWFRFAGRKARRTFAFAHMMNGIFSYILSLINIGTSYDLGMPCGVNKFVGGLAACNIVCHAFMTIHFYKLDKGLGLYINRALYPFTIPPVTYKELPGKRVRLGILILHFVGTFIVSSMMLAQYFMTKGCECKSDFCRDKGV